MPFIAFKISFKSSAAHVVKKKLYIKVSFLNKYAIIIISSRLKTKTQFLQILKNLNICFNLIFKFFFCIKTNFILYFVNKNIKSKKNLFLFLI